MIWLFFSGSYDSTALIAAGWYGSSLFISMYMWAASCLRAYADSEGPESFDIT